MTIAGRLEFVMSNWNSTCINITLLVWQQQTLFLLLLQQKTWRKDGMPFADLWFTNDGYLINRKNHMPVLADNALKQLFTEAHTEHHFSDASVSDEVIHQ
ncbi:hypothetical protein ACFQ2T_02905 [Methylophilus flavus]|uniref:Uncharacterized protein n=1 Tax=Methylophilus flavus TaxID=640084 RepID=A0ABW3P5W9_9PROT